MIPRGLIKLFSTFFYLGYLPPFPGTYASLAGVMVYLIISANNSLYYLITAFVLILGLAITSRAEIIFEKKDPRCIVIDEVAGVLICYLFMPVDIKLIFIGFILFRVMDALKPYPANLIQRFKGSIGVMGDDIVAGLYTNLLLQLLIKFTSFRTS